MWCVRNDHHGWLASTSAPGSGNSQRSADAPIVAQLITDTLGSAQDQHQSVLHFVVDCIWRRGCPNVYPESDSFVLYGEMVTSFESPSFKLV